jgi:hypothetical protein
MVKKRNDATGWERGAGPYSRSYLKTTDKPAPGMAGRYPRPSPSAQRMGNTGSSVRGSVEKVQDLIAGKDISAKTWGYKGKEGAGAFGFSAVVSKGTRPKHKADPRSKRRV